MTETKSSWHKKLLAWFTPQIASVAPVTILIDPDGLYDDPPLLAAIQEAGFDILRFDDPLRFRLTYEREYRERWDRGETTRPLVIHSTLPGDQLPYDLVEEVVLADHIRTVKVSDFFDRLDPNLVLALDRDLLAKLWKRYQEKPPRHGGENATADYLLAELFGLNPDQWSSDADLLAALMAYHYAGRRLPTQLVNRLVARSQPRFPEWPLREFWLDRDLFYRFLSERWARYVHSSLPTGQAGLADEPSAFVIKGPLDLPFHEKQIRVYMDTLFLEGAIRPLKGVDRDVLPAAWMHIGVAALTEADHIERFKKQTERLTQDLPAADGSHHQWLSFGRKFGEWLSVRWSLTLPVAVEEEAQNLHAEVESRFAVWLASRFSALLSLPPIPLPLVVSQVAPHMARGWIKQDRSRRALVVVDGMNWAQWSILRRQLDVGPDANIQEASVLTFVPSITQVSRQAIFAGELPRNFAASIGTTSKEESLWRRFWEGQGALKTQVGYLLYQQGEPLEEFLDRLSDLTGKPTVRIIGVVLGQVDALTHGAAGIVTSRELQQNVAAWGKGGTLQRVLDHLLATGYEIWLTSDHGNIEATGVGNPGTGSLTEERSDRALVFKHANLREAAAEKFPNALVWQGAGLPDDYYPLVATGFEAFTTAGKLTLSHGGISVEEMVVPFVRMGHR